MSAIHVLLPDMVDDPGRPSGGSIYDRRLLGGLRSLGWDVVEHLVPGPWPSAPIASRRQLRQVVAGIPYGATVLVDGIVASTTPEILVPAASRTRLVVLLHLPVGETFPESGDVAGARRDEAAVLAAASAVVVTSRWTQRRVLDRYGLDPALVHVAEPGADHAPSARPSPSGDRLVQVAPLTPVKGHDVLLAALDRLRDRPWSLRLVGAADLDPAWAQRLAPAIRSFGDRVLLTGPLGRAQVDEVLATSDLVVVPSRTETYGMVLTEALARGIPVVAAETGGLPGTLRGTDGLDLPGALVAPDDPAALADVLGRWLDDETLRARWRSAARARRATLHGWDETARTVSEVLGEVAGSTPSAVAR